MGQSGNYIFKIRVRTTANACGLCNHKPIKSVFVGTNDSKRTPLGNALIHQYNYYSYNSWYTQYYSIPVNKANGSYSIHWYNDVRGKWEKFDLYAKLNETQTHFFHTDKGNAVWHTASMDIEIETYDVAGVGQIQTGSESQASVHCVDNENTFIKFNLTVINKNGPRSVTIYAYDNNRMIGSYSKTLSWTSSGGAEYKSVIECPVKQFNIHNYYGKKITFKVSVSYGGITIDTEKREHTFFPVFKLNGNITVKTPNCKGDPYTISIPYSAGDDLEKYVITIQTAPATGYGKSYQKGGTNSEKMEFSGSSILIKDEDIKSGYYSVRVEYQSDTTNPCAFSSLVYIPTMPDFTVTAEVKKPAGTNQYQITAPNGTGEVSASFSGSTSMLNTVYAENVQTHITYPVRNLAVSSGVQNTYNGSGTFHLPQGTYTIHVSNPLGCKTKTTGNITLTAPDSIHFTLENTKKVSCHDHGQEDGEITLRHLSGGIPPYTYSHELFFENVDTVIKNLSTGNCRIVVTDFYGNQYEKTVTVASNPPISVRYVSSPPTLPCGDDGKIIITSSSGGMGRLEYNRANDLYYSFNDTVKGYVSGSQKLYVKDSLGCMADFDVNIPAAPSGLELKSLVLKHTSCSYKNDGGAVLHLRNVHGSLSVTSATAPCEIIDSAVYVDHLSSGTYHFILTDTTSCSLPVTFTVLDKAPITVTHEVTNVSDKGTNTGSIVLNSISGGSGSYEVRLMDETNSMLETVSNAPYRFARLAGSAYDGGKIYQLEITDSAGCSYREQTGNYYAFKILEPQEKLTLSAHIQQQVSCNGYADASIELTPEGGWGNYRFGKNRTDWSSSSMLYDLGAGTYTFYLQDHGGGIDSVSVLIAQPAPLAIAADSIRHVWCYGEENGQVNYRVSGGTYPYSFYPNRPGQLYFHGGDTLLAASNLAAASYQLTVRDANGCEVQDKFSQEVKQPEKLEVSILSIKNTVCAFQDNGALTALVSGGVEPYMNTLMAADFSWQDSIQLYAQDSIRFSGIPANTYYIITSDRNSCKAQSSVVTVEEYTNPWISSFASENITCFGLRDGNINITASEGTYPLAHITLLSVDSSFVQTNTSGIFEFLYPNTYYTEVYDINGCKSIDGYPATIGEPEELTVQVDSVHHVAGKGTASGFVSFRIAGGNSGTKQIRMMTADGTEIARKQERSGAPLVFSGLQAGRYVIDAIDKRGCAVVSDTLVIEEPATELGFKVISKGDALCKSQTGNIIVEGYGGWGDYRYKRLANSAFFSQNSFTQLYAGTYLITVRDRMGATYSETVTVYEPRDSLSATLTALSPPSCGDNGSLTVKISGGTAPYRLSANEDTLLVALPQSVQLTGKTAGAWLLKTLDANGCHFDLEAFMPDTSLLQIASFEVAYPSAQGAADGEIRAVVRGGRQPLAWQWKERFGAPLSANDAVLENIPSGHYQADVTDDSGCAVTGYVYLPDHTDAVFEVISIGHETSYQAGDGSAVLYSENDVLTDYRLISPDGRLFSFDASSFDIHFHTRNDTIFLNGLSGGEWFISGENPYGDRVISVIHINPYQLFKFEHTRIFHVRESGASNGEVNIETSGGGGGNRFEWAGTDGAISSVDDSESSAIRDVPAGVYTVAVTDRYGNSIQESFTVLEPEKPLKITVSEQQNESCRDYRDAYVVLSAEGGWGEYHFRHDMETYPSTRSGYSALDVRSHYFYLTDRAGVTDSIEVSVTEPEYLHASVLQIDSATCKDASDGKISFSVSGGTAPYRLSDDPFVNWRSGTELAGLPEGWHTVAFTDSHGCIGQDTLTVYVPEPDALLFDTVLVTHTVCNEDNGAITVEMQGGTTPYQYRWTDAQNLPAGDQNHIAGLQQGGLYRLTVTDRNGCGQQLQQVIYPSSRPVIDHIAVTPVVCYGESTGTAAVTAVTAGQPFAPWHLEWSNGEQTEEGNVGDAVHYAYGMHYVTVADTNGCATVRYFDVSQPDFLRPVLLDSKEPHCYGWDDAFLQTVALGGVAPYLFRWSNGDTVAIADNLTAGEYLLLLVDANRCRAQATYTMDEPEELFVDLGAGITMCPGNTFTVDGHSFPAYRWFTESGGNLSDERYLAVREAGDYRLEATDERGCAVKGQFTVAIGNNALDAAFLLPSTAAEGDTLVLIELSNLPVDSLRWEYDLQAFVPVNDPGQQGYLLMLLCRKTGMYNIGLTAWSGGCTSYVVSQTDIVPASEKPEESALGYKDPLIRSLTAYPNPSNGFFDVEIELREKTDIRLTLFDVASGQRMGDRLEYGMDRYLLHYALTGYRSGVYLLLLTAGNERKQVKIVIQK